MGLLELMWVLASGVFEGPSKLSFSVFFFLFILFLFFFHIENAKTFYILYYINFFFHIC